MPPYSHQPVVRALYRAYLRFAHRVDQDAPELRHSIGVLPGVSAVQHVRHAFRKPRPFYDNELETSTCEGTELRQIQRGLKLLRIYDEKFRNRVPEIEDIIYRISTKRDSSHWVEEGALAIAKILQPNIDVDATRDIFDQIAMRVLELSENRSVHLEELRNQLTMDIESSPRNSTDSVEPTSLTQTLNSAATNQVISYYSLSNSNSEFFCDNDGAKPAKQKHPKFLPEESRQSVMENLHSVLFDKQYGLGLEGNRLNYMEPENSNIAQVLVRGTGIPITLSAIYMAVGSRLGLPVHGVNTPGHFLVGVQLNDRDIVYVDPFWGGHKRTRSEMRERLDKMQIPAEFHTRVLEPASLDRIMIRMALNLVHVYQHHGDEQLADKWTRITERIGYVTREMGWQNVS